MASALGCEVNYCIAWFDNNAQIKKIYLGFLLTLYVAVTQFTTILRHYIIENRLSLNNKNIFKEKI